jgi:hypothetical protein
VVSRIWTNIVRFAVAALLGLAACLVAWWPQSAAGSGDPAALSAVAAAPTQNTPTPTKTPTATVAPTTAAPPPPAPPPAQPTHKPTSKPTHKPTHHSGGSSGGSHHQPTTLHNNGGSNGGSHQSSGGSSNTKPTPPASTHTAAPYVPPVAPSTPVAHPTTHPTTQQSPSAPTSAPTTEAPTPDAQATADAGDQTKGAGDAETYDTYLTSSEPVETKAAPVWVVPGILLVLVTMLALLGGVLGRGNRPALAPAKAVNENASDDES